MEEFKFFKKFWWLIILTFVGLSILTWICTRTSQTIDYAIINYEEFQDTYNTCVKLNTDLCNMKDLDPKDPMFDQFSKNQRVNTLRTQLNRWVEDYNAKSKMWKPTHIQSLCSGRSYLKFKYFMYSNPIQFVL